MLEATAARKEIRKAANNEGRQERKGEDVSKEGAEQIDKGKERI